MRKTIRQLGNSIATSPDITHTDGFIKSTDDDPFIKSIGTAESGKLRVVLEPSSFSKDSFELWRLYQSKIHLDPPNKRILFF
jgi:arginyl-tRNA--protein-N-Asp/Glu arginylyltransferase